MTKAFVWIIYSIGGFSAFEGNDWWELSTPPKTQHTNGNFNLFPGDSSIVDEILFNSGKK